MEINKTKWQQRCQWLTSPLGQALLAVEGMELSRILPKTRLGRFGLIFHAAPLFDAVVKTRVRDLVCATPEVSHEYPHHLSIVSDPQALPLLENTMSMVFLPHILELTESPEQALAEAVNALTGEGMIVITGFNPTSFWGLKRLWTNDKMPYLGRFVSPNRIRRFLKNNDCQLLKTRTVYYRPPVSCNKVQAWMRFMEVLGRLCWPAFGGAYVIVAQKKMVTLTPMTATWKVKNFLTNKGLIAPTPRSRI